VDPVDPDSDPERHSKLTYYSVINCENSYSKIYAQQVSTMKEEQQPCREVSCFKTFNSELKYRRFLCFFSADQSVRLVFKPFIFNLKLTR
jgi:hypothetical protein